MTATVWIAIVIAVIVVACAIGIPYFLTHRRMTDHYEHEQSETYLEGTGRTPDDVASGRTGRPWRSRAGKRRQTTPSA